MTTSSTRRRRGWSIVTPDYMHDTLRAALDARASGAIAEPEGEVTTAMMLGAADMISWTVSEVRQAAA